MSDTTLRTHLDSLLLEHSVSPSYEKALIHRLDCFGHYLGHIATFDDLQPDPVNRWVKSMQESGQYKPKTIRHFLHAVLFVWRDLFERGLCEKPPHRIRRVKLPGSVVHAWTLDELRSLAASTAILRGNAPGTDIRKRDWMLAFILVVYCTAIRRCDAMNHALRGDLTGDVLCLCQNKTGYVVVRRLTPQAMDALSLLPNETEYLLPWGGDVRRFYESFKRCVVKAGIRPGGPKMLRRSGGSYHERDNPGQGGEFLGHKDRTIFDRCYHDRAITSQIPPPPPEI